MAKFSLDVCLAPQLLRPDYLFGIASKTLSEPHQATAYCPPDKRTIPKAVNLLDGVQNNTQMDRYARYIFNPAANSRLMNSI